MKLYFKKMYFLLMIIYLSTKAIRRLNIGDEVIYNGKRYFLNQGVYNPKWSMSDGSEYIENVHRDEFKKVNNPKAWWKSFRHSYDFYMNYWYGIWCRNGIEPWMRNCKIWNKD